jgi:hypothetical protein
VTLVVEENYVNGVPQTALAGWAPSGAASHWSAGGSGRAGWEGTIRHLVNTRLMVNASYHGGFWHEHDPGRCRTIIQWIVPTTRAAHSIAPSVVFRYNANKDRATQDARFAEVRRILGTKASDPNAACLAIAYAGMPADLERDLACPEFRADVQNLARQLVAHPAVIDRPHFGHGWIQPIDRYEMDVAAADFIALLYATTPIPEPEPVDVPLVLAPVQEDWTSVAGQPFYTEGPGMGEKFWADSATKFRTHFEEVIYGADGQPTTKPRGYRLASYQDHPGAPWEVLYVPRLSGTPIKGTRVPTSGYGLPPQSQPADCTEQVNAAKTATASKANAQMDAWLATRPPIQP